MAANEDLQHICVGCRVRAPEVETEYTLISGRFGWRLTRRIDRDGSFLMEWRCATCWKRYKTDKHLSTTPSEGLPAFRESAPRAAASLRSSSTAIEPPSSRPSSSDLTDPASSRGKRK